MTNLPTNRPTSGQAGSFGSYTSNNNQDTQLEWIKVIGCIRPFTLDSKFLSAFPLHSKHFPKPCSVKLLIIWICLWSLFPVPSSESPLQPSLPPSSSTSTSFPPAAWVMTRPPLACKIPPCLLPPSPPTSPYLPVCARAGDQLSIETESRDRSVSRCVTLRTRAAQSSFRARGAHCAQLILPGWKWALATKRAFNRGGGDGDSACEPNKELFSPSMGTYTPQNKANCSLPLLSGAWKRFYFFLI